MKHYTRICISSVFAMLAYCFSVSSLPHRTGNNRLCVWAYFKNIGQTFCLSPLCHEFLFQYFINFVKHERRVVRNGCFSFTFILCRCVLFRFHTLTLSNKRERMKRFVYPPIYPNCMAIIHIWVREIYCYTLQSLYARQVSVHNKQAGSTWMEALLDSFFSLVHFI